MFTPESNEETCGEVMHEFSRAHPLGPWTLLGVAASAREEVRPFHRGGDAQGGLPP